ncbi:MAG: tRNA 5-methoxyuridine(34)/uridine 5-oxyacetic acid(34) synthase CmoB [Candidatus Methylumidiphilus sp.]
MLDYASLYDTLSQSALRPLLEALPAKLASALDPAGHGDLGRWQGVLAALPEVKPSRVDLGVDKPVIGVSGDCSAATAAAIEDLLRKLHPWRKGPYLVHGVDIDSEWRSDLKWRRLSGHIESLRGKTVLDVGCGNGYHAWRMAGAGAGLVLGIDPTLLSVMQFHAIKHFVGACPVHVLPLGVEDMPRRMRAFDTVFSMGVLYHRRSPLDHLAELREFLRPGGELVLETLVVEGEEGHALVPQDRYARMRNVWFIPSCATLQGWLKRCGWRDIRLIDVSVTTPEEQRSTDWMRFQSLVDCLDTGDHNLTIEGLPSPRRAIFLARTA